MSREQLSEFMKLLAEDSALQEELRNAAEGTGDDAVVSSERLVEIARARGFEFTVEEAEGVFELSDDELDAVAGGLTLGQSTRYYKEQRSFKSMDGLLPLGGLISSRGGG